LPPHNPLNKPGIIGKISSLIEATIVRKVPTNSDPDFTVEKMHSSVFLQTLDDNIANWPKAIVDAVLRAKANKSLIAPMDPFEQRMIDTWKTSGLPLPKDSHEKGALKA
jgi:hypothetical protein